MDLGVISVRYARALLKSSEQSHQEEKVYHDMQNLRYPLHNRFGVMNDQVCFACQTLF